ncbi:hypothetical protein F5B22DRAFT_634351 [Xylaria bambusicola]|uniref:uncharacterized protein n=1 Tax=Xylaria bambusicola TaxID=326684 RepID=UPI002007FEC1|nr:uncharacterized protein F5B22DRAFT_634351 [Xylaria bambusicola]KAI0521983.1 hypothetical protein F5B22DRAFT_634351 [Xylaria bambusicola]
MSVVYETRNPLPTSAYVSPEDNRDPKVTAFNHLNPNGDPTLIPSSSPTPSASSLAPTTPPNHYSSPPAVPDTKTGTPKNTQPRMKPIPKPQRQVVKNRDGKFICTWNGCNALTKEFSRKCEWNKHMDKHERPYKCLAVGCENINGFTYSGGLLRHEREVHRKHGGPKNPLYCPHKGCKRHKNSSFARLENLNEHLRRCHTSSGLEASTQNDESDLAAVNSHLEALPGVVSPLPAPILPVADSPVPSVISPTIGMKRNANDEELREENKRLRSENQELRRKIEAGYLQQCAMMEQIDLLEKEKAALLGQSKDGDIIDQSSSIS